MRDNIKDKEIVLKGSDPVVIETALKEMVSLNLHTILEEVSCISSFDQNQKDILATIIDPCEFSAPSKSIYVLSKTL